MNVPRAPQGDTPFHKWAKEVSRWLNLERLVSGRGYRKRQNAGGGYTLDLNERPSAQSAGGSTGGLFRGPGYGAEVDPGENDFPDRGYDTYDFVWYIAYGIDPAPQTHRALWEFAWSGPDGSSGDGGPIVQIHQIGLNLVPTSGRWFLKNYVPIDDASGFESEQCPNDTATQLLLDNYPDQVPP
jgi:hypothetical protein